MKKNARSRLVALISLLLVAVTALSSCSLVGYKTKALTPTELDDKVVGTIGGYEVTYDVYSYIVYHYRNYLENKYGEGIWENEETVKEYLPELQSRVLEGLGALYNVLVLCEENGYKDPLNKRDIKVQVDEYIYTLVYEAYEELKGLNKKPSENQTETTAPSEEDGAQTGSSTNTETSASKTEVDTDLNNSQMREAYEYYESTLRAEGLTDRVIRLFAAVGYAEAVVYEKLCESGKLPYSDDDVWEIMESDEFIRTDHIFIRCDTQEDFEEKYALALEVRDGLRGGKELKEYIIDGTDQDFSRLSTAGYYFVRGEMDEAYEEAAFALKVGETSDVVRTDSGYYIIQRYEKDVKYMNAYFDQHAGNVTYAKFLEYVDEVGSRITFELNDYGKTLDLLTVMPDMGTAKGN